MLCKQCASAVKTVCAAQERVIYLGECVERQFLCKLQFQGGAAQHVTQALVCYGLLYERLGAHSEHGCGEEVVALGRKAAKNIVAHLFQCGYVFFQVLTLMWEAAAHLLKERLMTAAEYVLAAVYMYVVKFIIEPHPW